MENAELKGVIWSQNQYTGRGGNMRKTMATLALAAQSV